MTEYADARWRIGQVYDGVIMSVDQLRKIVAEKELKSKKYRLCDAYWLLVIVDFMDRAQDQEIGTGAITGLVSRVFEKVIVYKTCFGEIVETS